ncbi:MAG: alpha-(1-2)-phosphatidylinositol mannosyltransferase [Chloroflexi bacterium]|nr:alpha-(1-2)-phosphatidylinositol mannosyltransferase [Chloroflexota bacterium]
MGERLERRIRWRSGGAVASIRRHVGLDSPDRRIRLLGALALLGAAAGLAAFGFYLVRDTLIDVNAYWEAGARLNAGEPLYPEGADPDVASFYRYPPLLAILFRPLALLPFPVAAVIWETLVVASLVLTVRRLGIDRISTWQAVGILGVAIGWAVAIGQAQVVVTWLVTLGSPWAVALAGNLKVFPWLVALFWLGRGDWRAVGLFTAWTAGLLAFQLVLEPANTVAFFQSLTLDQVGEVENLSPYGISPVLWAVLAVAGFVAVLALARTRWGWATAVAYSVLVVPRLMTYMLMTLLAALRAPGPAQDQARAGAPVAPARE